MKIKNEFFFFIKNEFSFSKTKLIYALKITIAASIGGAIAFYLSYYKQIGLGWWIGSSIFAIPSITLAASLKKGIQRINATFLGCFVGFILSLIIEKNNFLFILFTLITTSIWCTLRFGSKKFSYQYFLSGILSLMIMAALFENESPLYIAFARVIDTIIGVIITLVIFYCLWPKRQKIIWQVFEHEKIIVQKLALIYEHKSNSILHEKELNSILNRRMEIQIIDELSLLKQFQDDIKLEFFEKDKKIKLINETFSYYEELFILIKSLPKFSITEGKSIAHLSQIKPILEQIFSKISQSIKENKLNSEIELLFHDLKEKLEISAAQKEFLNYSIISNLEFYSFIDSSEKIINKINFHMKSNQNEIRISGFK
jgi:uncharacterized membrane protein YgaE (UPF0421/DUF939 family)